MNNSTTRGNDFHYYMHDGSDALRFQLVGRLSMDAALDLERAWSTALSVIGERLVIVDLSQLTGIDGSGQELLGKWTRQGVRLGVISHRAKARVSLLTDQPVFVFLRARGESLFRVMRAWVSGLAMCLPDFPQPPSKRRPRAMH